MVEAAEAEVAVAVAEVIAFRGYSFRLEYDEIFLTNFVKSYSISFGNTKKANLRKLKDAKLEV